MDSQYGDKKSNDENSSNVIKLPDCPRCKTPIRRNLRYSSYVKRQLLAIEQVKIRSTGTRDEINQSKTKFKNYLIQNESKFEAKHSNAYSNLKRYIENERNLSKVDFIELENRIMLFLKLVQIESKNRDAVKEIANKRCLVYEVNKINKILLHKDFKTIESFSEQSQAEISSEIERIDRLFQYFKCKEYFAQRSDANLINKARVYLLRLDYLLVTKILTFDAIESEVRELFTKIQPLLSGLQISNEERVMILKAMGFKQGHWFKCKNGHVYCITECGGANQESNCPECGDKIGGTNHRLVDSNKVATEMVNYFIHIFFYYLTLNTVLTIKGWL